jgi:putative transposase
MPIAKEHANYFTATCFEWKPILKDDRFKQIIVDSLQYLSTHERVNVYAFAIMNNHIHLIWQMLGDHTPEDVQRDFLRFTSQQIIKVLRNENSDLLEELIVNARDRKHQVWERKAFSMPVYEDKFLFQKLEYIHNNPVVAGYCEHPADYRYSSAAFYLRGKMNFDFLKHIDG